MKKFSFYLILILPILFLISCGSDASGDEAEDVTDSTTVEMEEEELPEDAGDQVDGVIKVSSAQEFLEAIESDVYIELAPGTFDLTNVELPRFDEYGEEGSSSNRPTVYKSYDDVVVYGVDNLTIKGADGSKPLIIISPEYGTTITFRNCDDLTLGNFEAGHGPEKGVCDGAVLRITDSKDVEVDDCVLFGCGTEALVASNVQNLKCKNTEMKECTYGGASLSNCTNVELRKCRIHHNTDVGYAVYSYQSRKIGLINTTIEHNSTWTSGHGSLVSASESDQIWIENCTIRNNSFAHLAEDPAAVKIVTSNVGNNEFYMGEYAGGE